MWSTRIVVQCLLGILILVFQAKQSFASDRDYFYDIVDENPKDYIDRTAERDERDNVLQDSRTRSPSKCLGAELPYNILDLKACDESSGSEGTCPNKISFNSSSQDDTNAAKVDAYKTLLKLAKESKEYHTQFWPNIITIVVKCIPIVYFAYLVIFTNHFNRKAESNPRILDGTSVQGQREWIYLRPKFHLWDGSVTPHRLVGQVQRQVLWRNNVEGANDWNLAQRSYEGGKFEILKPKRGASFHMKANAKIPEVDEDKLTEGQVLKRRIKKFGMMSHDEFLFNVEQVRIRRLLLAATEEYHRRLRERGKDPGFDAVKEAEKSMEIAVLEARAQRISNFLRMAIERKERDRIINIQWEKTNKSFRLHRKRLRERQEIIDYKRAAKIAKPSVTRFSRT